MKPEKHLKKIVSRICGGGILSIASLSLVGVGFSSWLITGKDNPTRDTPLDSIGADGEFCDINKYVNGLQVTATVFADHGFKSNADDSTSNTNPGTIACSFRLNTLDSSDPLSNHIPSGYNLVLVVNLSSKNKNGEYSDGYSIFQDFDTTSSRNRYDSSHNQAGNTLASTRTTNSYSMTDSFVVPMNDSSYSNAFNGSFVTRYVTFQLKIKEGYTIGSVYNDYFEKDSSGNVTNTKKDRSMTASVHREISKQ